MTYKNVLGRLVAVSFLGVLFVTTAREIENEIERLRSESKRPN